MQRVADAHRIDRVRKQALIKLSRLNPPRKPLDHLHLLNTRIDLVFGSFALRTVYPEAGRLITKRDDIIVAYQGGLGSCNLHPPANYCIETAIKRSHPIVAKPKRAGQTEIHAAVIARSGENLYWQIGKSPENRTDTINSQGRLSSRKQTLFAT